MTDEERYQLTGSWEAAAALRDAQNIALNQYNWSQAAENKASVQNQLQNQILSQGTTSQWQGEGKGSAEANAADMAKILADAGITDISQFGKVTKAVDVQVIPQIETVVVGYDNEYNQIVENKIVGYTDQKGNAVDPSLVKTDYVYEGEGGGQTVYIAPVGTETTFGNKLTGQAVADTYGERQTGDAFGGTYTGKGNTAYNVQFDESGKPVFYTTGASSSDTKNIARIIQAGLLLSGAGGALGGALGLTGSAATGVGTGLISAGTSAIGGANLEDALKTGLLSGGLAYGGNVLNNYLTTGTVADPSITERAFATLDAKQLADQGLTATQIKDTLSSGGYNDITIERALSSLTGTPVAVSTPVTDTSAVNITAPANVSLNNVLSTIAGTAPVAVSTPVTDGGTVKVTAPSTQMTTQQAVDLVNSQIAANVTKPTNLANVQVTDGRPTSTQDLINTIASTLPALTTGTNTPVNTTTTPEIATQTITAKTPTKIGDTLAAITTIPSTLTTTPVTSTTTTTADKTKETDPLKVAQLALAAAGLLGAGSALSNTGTGTQFPIVPIPEGWRTPPPTGVAPFTPLPPINFGDRNLLIGTQWEKFLDPNYGKVPEPIRYSQPSSLSYNDLMGILGSRQGMPPASSLSINDIISGIQNQYGQAPTRTMG